MALQVGCSLQLDSTCVKTEKKIRHYNPLVSVVIPVDLVQNFITPNVREVMAPCA
jgi:hypothetical protein